MKKIILLIVFSILVIESFAQVNFPTGRIAVSFDGNHHDEDDIGAAPLAVAILKYAGLEDRIAHMGYNGHLGVTTPSQQAAMVMSLEGIFSRLNLNDSVLFDDYDNTYRSVVHLADQINKSSSNDLIWIVAAGPVEVLYQAIAASDPNKHQYIRMVSHHTDNENHDNSGHGGCGPLNNTWSDIQSDFPNVVFMPRIANQNSSNGELDFRTDPDKWYWLRDGNPDWNWIFNRNPFSWKYDVSDAGMVYWVISGGPNGGCDTCGSAETRAIFESYNDTIHPHPTPTVHRIEAESAYDKSYNIFVEATSDVEGDSNLYHIKPFKWAKYTMTIPQSGQYKVRYRVSANNHGGFIGFEYASVVLETTEIPVTGSWDTWVTVEDTFYIPAGTHDIELLFDKPGASSSSSLFNLNWIELEFLNSSVTGSRLSPMELKRRDREIASTLEVIEVEGWAPYPNPFTSYINLPNTSPETITVRNISGKIVLQGEYSNMVEVPGPAGVYIVEIKNKNYRVIKL